MKLYMSRMKYRMEMPNDVVLGNFKGAAEFALARASSRRCRTGTTSSVRNS